MMPSELGKLERWGSPRSGTVVFTIAEYGFGGSVEDQITSTFEDMILEYTGWEGERKYLNRVESVSVGSCGSNSVNERHGESDDR